MAVKSVRITNYLRRLIVSEMLKPKRASIDNDFNKREGELFARTVDAIIGKHRKAMESLPEDWFKKVARLTVIARSDAEADDIDLSLANKQLADGKWVAVNVCVPYLCVTAYGPRFSFQIEEHPQLAADLKAFHESKNDVEVNFSKVERDLTNLMAQYNTSRKLEAEWPEAFEVFLKCSPEVAETASVPAKSLKNVMFALEMLPDSVAETPKEPAKPAEVIAL